MKREFGMLLVLLSLSFVFAGTCDDDQTIMRLYSESNSHVSFWDEMTSSYIYEVCYDDIFGYEYSGSDPHGCDGNNFILSAYDRSNAHVSTYEDAYYDNNICYGDLECEYEDGAGGECDNGGEVVVRLYDNYNSHISLASDSSYGLKVCCVSSGIYWADMNGNKITEAEVGDTVKMIYRNGIGGDMVIREEDVLGDDEVETVTASVEGGLSIGVWTIDAGSDLDGDSEFYFEINGEVSDNLIVSNDGSDDPMDVLISSPECGLYYDEGGLVNIIVEATDDDDLITGEVSVDGTVVSSFSNGGISLSYDFEAVGDIQVLVNAANTRGEKYRSTSNVMVLDKDGSSYVDGEYVAACIAEPEDYTHIDSGMVWFDASTTRGIRVVDGVLEELIPGDYPFSWYWIFSPDNYEHVSENSVDSSAYQFYMGFPTAGENSANLRVEV